MVVPSKGWRLFRVKVRRKCIPSIGRFFVSMGSPTLVLLRIRRYGTDDEKSAKMRAKRKNLVLELLETERSYVAQLIAVEQVYIAGLRQDKSMSLGRRLWLAFVLRLSGTSCL